MYLHSQSRVTAARATTSTCLVCYRFIKRSTNIDKSLLREGLVFDVKCDTTPFVNTSLVKLRYQQLDLFNSNALTSAHKVHVHCTCTCTPLLPLRHERACVVDSLGLGITCVLYRCTMCTRHPNPVSFAFYAISIFHILI